MSTAACTSCRSRKQKCDKALPVCSRCQRLLLKCHYTAPIPIPSPPPDPISTNLLDLGFSASENALTQSLSLLLTPSHSVHLTTLIHNHKPQLIHMAEYFLSTCQKWLAVVHKDAFRSRCNDTHLASSKDFISLLLAMGMITRPLMRGDEPDALREAMYEAVKTLFWDKDSVSRPSLSLIQAGLLLAVYEYGHGLLNASFVTIGVCSSMAQLSGLCNPGCPPLPRTGSLVSEDEMLHTWWGILVHERMLSLKTNLPVRHLHIPPQVMDNFTLEEEIRSLMPKVLLDPHYPSFYLQARAALWLDRVLQLVRSPTATSPEGRMRFQTLDRGLLHFLRILVQLGLGTCCEAISIGMNAFFHLHHWRLEATSSSCISGQDQEESAQAIRTLITVLSDISGNEVQGHAVQNEPDRLIEPFPYTITMMYQLLLELRGQQRQWSTQPGMGRTQQIRSFEDQMGLIRFVLERQSVRWEISRQYVIHLDSMS